MKWLVETHFVEGDLKAGPRWDLGTETPAWAKSFQRKCEEKGWVNDRVISKMPEFKAWHDSIRAACEYIAKVKETGRRQSTRMEVAKTMVSSLDSIREKFRLSHDDLEAAMKTALSQIRVRDVMQS